MAADFDQAREDREHRDSRAIGKLFDLVDGVVKEQAVQSGAIRHIESTLREFGDVLRGINQSRQLSPTLVVMSVGVGVTVIGAILAGLIYLMSNNITNTVGPLMIEMRAVQQAQADANARVDRISAAMAGNTNNISALNQFTASGFARVETQLYASSLLKNQEHAFNQTQLCEMKQRQTPGYQCPPYIFFPVIGVDRNEPQFLRGSN